MTLNARMLILSGTISYFGGALTKMTHASIFANFVENTTEFSFFFIALSLPPILFKKVLKHILDNFKARYILTFSQLLRGLLLLTQLLFMEHGLLGKIGLCTFIFFHSTIQCVFISSLFTHLPAIINEDERERYLARSGSWSQVGYLLGVIMFTLIGISTSLKAFLIIDLFAYIFSAFVFGTLRKCKVGQHSNINKQNNIEKDEKNYSKLDTHVERLSSLKKAFLISLPVILLDLFFSVSTTTALSISKLRLGTTGFGIIEILFRFGVIIVGFTYERFFHRLIHTYRSWLAFLGGSCCFILAMITMPSQGIFLYAISAFFIGASYSALITVSRSVFYSTQHSSTYNRAIVMINLIESIGQISIMLATAYLINNTILIVILISLFFMLSFFMTSHVSYKSIIKKASNVCKSS